jgi:formylglycine-generating enzyme required for sulfatase activity
LRWMNKKIIVLNWMGKQEEEEMVMKILEKQINQPSYYKNIDQSQILYSKYLLLNLAEVDDSCIENIWQYIRAAFQDSQYSYLPLFYEKLQYKFDFTFYTHYDELTVSSALISSIYKDVEGLFFPFISLVSIVKRSGYWNKALKLYEQLFLIAERLSDKNFFIHCVEEKMGIYLQLSLHKEAKTTFELLKKENDTIGRVDSNMNNLYPGWLSYVEEDYGNAEQCFLKVPNDISKNYWLLKTFVQQGKIDKAKVYFELDNEYLKKITNRDEIAHAYSWYALYYLKSGELEKAVEYWVTAQNTWRLLGIKIDEIKELQKIEATIIQSIGQNQFLEEAKKYETKKIEVAQPDYLLTGLPPTRTMDDGKEMVLIPEGIAFIGIGAMPEMGFEKILDNMEQYFSNENEKNEMTPIFIYPYYIDKYPVSNVDYLEFCKTTTHPYPSHWENGIIPSNAEKHPVVNISLANAKAYAAWVGKMIPTDAEWEKACRGPEGLNYPWGNEWDASRIISRNMGIAVRCKIFDKFKENYRLIENEAIRAELEKIKTDRQLDFVNDEFITLLSKSPTYGYFRKIDAVENLVSDDGIVKNYETLLRELQDEAKFILGKKEVTETYLIGIPNYIIEDEIKNFEIIKDAYAQVFKNIQINTNASVYGVYDMVGSNYEWTDTQHYSECVIKGGSWRSYVPEEDCKAYNFLDVEAGTKRMDLGFRCVKPIFSKKDIPPTG